MNDDREIVELTREQILERLARYGLRVALAARRTDLLALADLLPDDDPVKKGAA
jgi:hypothetical protein